MRKIADRVSGSRLAEGLDGSLVGADEGLIGEVALAAQSNQEHPISQYTVEPVEQQRIAAPAVHIAAAHGLRDGAAGGGVEGLRGLAELAALVDAGDHATAALLVRRATLDEVFHRPFSRFPCSF